MEKSFRRYLNSRAARDAFVEAEATTWLAHQIRTLRAQRGLSQSQLAKKLGTTQTAISRLEDPSYGRISFKTFVALAKAFDVAPVMRFESTLKVLKERWTIRPQDLEVLAFEEEASSVGFVDPLPQAGVARIGSLGASGLNVAVVHLVPALTKSGEPAFFVPDSTSSALAKASL